MSVINQMLKDLEQRRPAQPEDFPVSQFFNIRAGGELPGQQLVKVRALWLIGLMLLVMSIFIIWKDQVHDSARGDLANQEVISGMSQVAASAEHQSYQRAALHKLLLPTLQEHSTTLSNALISVTGVHLHVYRNHTEVVLETNASVLRRLERVVLDPLTTQYKLDGVSLDARLPELANHSELLQTVRMGERGNSLILELEMKAGSVSSYRETARGDGQGYRTIIDIQRMPVGSIASEKPEASSGKLADFQQTKSRKLAQMDGSAGTVVKETRQASSVVEAGTRTIRRDRTIQPGAKTLYKNALGLLRSGHMESAINQLRKVITVSPDMWEVRETLAVALLKSGRFAEAGVLMDENYRLNPAYPGFGKLYGRFLADQGDYVKAEQILQALEKQGGEDTEYLALMAVIAQQRNQHQRAVDLYVKALDLNPQQGAWWIGMAISLEALGEKIGARQAYMTARDRGMLNQKLLQYAEQRIGKLNS